MAIFHVVGVHEVLVPLGTMMAELLYLLFLARRFLREFPFGFPRNRVLEHKLLDFLFLFRVRAYRLHLTRATSVTIIAYLGATNLRSSFGICTQIEQ